MIFRGTGRQIRWATAVIALLWLGVANAQSQETVLPEVVIALDTSESMQLSITDGKAPNCADKAPAPTRWAAVRQMLAGSHKDYACVKESLPSYSDGLTTPTQLVGPKTCIGGIDHVLSTRVAAKYTSTQGVGAKSYSGTLPGSTTRLRFMVTNKDVSLPYFSYDFSGVNTSEAWVEGELRLMTKDPSSTKDAIWAYLEMLNKDPATMPGQELVCEVMTQAQGNIVTGPTKINNKGGGLTLFQFNKDTLKVLQKAAAGGQTKFYFALVSQQAWFKPDCSARGDDLSEQIDMNFNGPGAAWSDQRPSFEVGTGFQCKREGPGAHFAPVGNQGVDGMLSKFVDAAKYAMLVPDVSMSVSGSAAGGYSFGATTGSYWGDINLGAQDPFLSGTGSVPMPRPDNSTARINSVNAIREKLKSIRPHGGTPLASLIEDIAAYFGPGKYQDDHFQSLLTDPSHGDPYFECRTRFAILFTDGGANLHTGASDGRSAAIQAAADLWTKNVALYVVVPGSEAIDKDDLDFLDELALAGGTVKAWRVNTASELTAQLKTILQAAGTSGQVLTPTVTTTSTGSDSEVQHSFHARSNFDVTEPMQTWGVVEQRVFGCSATCVDPKTPGRAQVCEVVDYEKKLLKRSEPRRLYSHINGKRRDLDDRNITPDDLLIPKTGLAPQLELDSGNNCVTKPNTFDLARADQRQSYATDVLAQVRGDPGSCRGNRLLGASGRSEMAFLGRAEQIPLSDPSFKSYASNVVPSSAEYSPSVPPGSARRPGMLFVATHEGVLHAFRTDRDATRLGVGKAETGDELFAWMPAFNLQRIRLLRLVADPERSFLGGSVVTGHVQLDRLGNTTEELAERWRAVVLVGAGEAGVGYTALDVTAPDDPRLLWEIAPNFHCFGSGVYGGAKGPKCLNVETFVGLGRSTAKPVIGSLYVKWKNVTTTRAVAIIAGGMRPKQASVANLGVDGTGQRAIWIVDMATGGLIKKLTTANMVFDGMTTTMEKKGHLGVFWSAPTCYQSAPGQIVSRCFIGDSRGMLWRVDLSDPDPSRWSINFFHDPYSADDTPVSYQLPLKSGKRVPVYTSPASPWITTAPWPSCTAPATAEMRPAATGITSSIRSRA